MKEIFSAFGSEVLRPLITLVFPGALVVGTAGAAIIWNNHAAIGTFVAGHSSEMLVVSLFLSLFFGLIFDDIGTNIESRFLDNGGEGSTLVTQITGARISSSHFSVSRSVTGISGTWFRF